MTQKITDDSTVAERIRSTFDTLTRAERQFANTVLESYPASGLGSVTALSETSGVSAPTIVRMAKKLGFAGFPQLQQQLRNEVEETISNPITRHEQWNTRAPDTHILNSFADAVMGNMRQTLSNLDLDEFDNACEMLANSESKVFVAGGRITGTLAEYLFNHMQMIRPHVTMVPTTASKWPHYVLDMEEGDVLAIFDIRRYENDLLKLAELATRKGVRVILFTDQWGSPIGKLANCQFNSRIEVPSAWDSSAVMLVIVETIIAKIQSMTWETTSTRMRDLEHLFDQTGLFRKFK